MEVLPSRGINVVKLVVFIPLGTNGATNFLGAAPKNASQPILVTLEGISTEIKEVQPENASSPMEVTLGGIITEIRE